MKPVRLAKQEETSHSLDFIGEWALDHAHIFLPLAFIILLLLIGCVIGVMVSGGNMTMTESNNYYYHIDDVVKAIKWRI